MAALQPLKFISVAPLKKHTATVIFVHGLGDSGHGWKPVADMFKRDPGLSHVKWVLPHAETMKVTANMGMEMPSWFDIYDFKPNTQVDESGMLRTAHRLNQLITNEIDSGIPANRIVLGGFSQGGAMAVLTGLSTERKLGGVIVLSAWVPLKDKFKAMASDHCKFVPIFWGHGKDDPLIKFEYGVNSVEYLKSALGIPIVAPDAPEKGGISFHSYDGVEHSTSTQELGDLKNWLKRVVPTQE
ncbi:Phospholipase/carboxylesterase [Obba rivulosa]|uniref:Acyl-protein thioesterase 1 n=1 Tax=Obba rivulosa TaxID=1052685 RepID=A0A8E2J4P1_9APHY|nr:Phospholipase/carboxylesterase [Obba rivulosa]